MAHWVITDGTCTILYPSMDQYDTKVVYLGVAMQGGSLRVMDSPCMIAKKQGILNTSIIWEKGK